MRTKARYRLFHEGKRIDVPSERAAKAWAREELGVERLHETPTENGWQYWSSRDPEHEEEPVTLVVL